MVICVARVWPVDNSCSFHVTAFYSFENEKITQADEYWADDGNPPQWRKNMQIGNKIY